MCVGQHPRASLSLILNIMAFSFAVIAVITSYWCEGSRKVVKPLCTGLSHVRRTYCISFNSSNLNDSRLVQYILETGENKFIMRKFHAGIWFSCEENENLTGFNCRSFLDIVPEDERGILWLCILAECLYINLLLVGGLLMFTEIFHCYQNMKSLKINAFAALCTVLSGLLGMVAHMMYTTAFQLAVALGPVDWRPHTWDYSWSYLLAWGSFTACLASAVTTLNRYTRTILELKHRKMTAEKKLKIQQLLFDIYSTFEPNSTLDIPAGGCQLSGASVIFDRSDLPDEYC
ncbi:germ cell-specific gene 1-like protein [Scleropages formosus]|uniref:germ cell-specific gene 1-like protein n=1 Tax=Scleropages formosus TaxID=113540 RepID=UPI0008780381|nr:germ cell-specific gene 1-like protein [Scleropages formosus]